MPFGRFFQQELIRELRVVWPRPDALSIRYPLKEQKIASGAVLHVAPDQVVQLVYRGEYGDQFGSGRHVLTKESLPVLNRLSSWPYGSGQPFQADLYFLNTGPVRAVPFRTYNAIFWDHAALRKVPLRFAGDFDARMVDPRRFLTEVAGADQAFYAAEFGDSIRLRMIELILQAARSAKLSVGQWRRDVAKLGTLFLPAVAAAARTEYGFDVEALRLREVTMPPEIETKLAAVGWGGD
ncbi:MAG: SPFH domain-containing protein [Verrucomicrobia bacterium]|nr:SPFH domain-containing protein [Verrucomicrobiota bacterium]